MGWGGYGDCLLGMGLKMVVSDAGDAVHGLVLAKGERRQAAAEGGGEGSESKRRQQVKEQKAGCVRPSLRSKRDRRQIGRQTPKGPGHTLFLPNNDDAASAFRGNIYYTSNPAIGCHPSSSVSRKSNNFE